MDNTDVCLQKLDQAELNKNMNLNIWVELKKALDCKEKFFLFH